MPESTRIREHSIAELMHALPLPTPPTDAWPALRTRLARRRQRRGWAMALAASIGLAAVTSGWWPNPDREPPPTASRAPMPDPAGTLAALISESSQLEALLIWSGDAWVETGDSALLKQHLDQQLQWVDLQLADAEDLPDQHQLWTTRVDLLRQRAQLAGSQLLLAESPTRDGDSPLAL